MYSYCTRLTPFSIVITFIIGTTVLLLDRYGRYHLWDSSHMTHSDRRLSEQDGLLYSSITNVTAKFLNGTSGTFHRITNICLQFSNSTDDWFNAEDYSFGFMLRYPLHPSSESMNELTGIKMLQYQSNPYFNMPSTVYLKGKTLMSNCCYRGSNPAHFLFGLSTFFEWTVSKPKDLPKFHRLAFLRCTEPRMVKSWPWGQSVLDTVLQRMLDSDVITDKVNPVIEPNRTLSQMMCFEELYAHLRWGVLFENHRYAKIFRKSLPLSSTAAVITTSPPPAEAAAGVESLHKRCKEKRLRVKIYTRDEYDGTGRRILNNPAVTSLLRSFTSHPVENITASWSDSMEDQYSIYNSFDILISSAGSQLTNLILINTTDVAIIEIGLAIRDTFWRENANRLKLRKYLYSHGHTPDEGCDSKHYLLNCTTSIDPQERGATICPTRVAAWSLTECDFITNLPLLKRHISKAVKALCSESRTSRTSSTHKKSGNLKKNTDK
eukprot:gene6361-12862_t